VEILAGLKEGDQVIMDDLEQFRPGQHVQVEAGN
jgi:hypothetical protein